MTEQQTIDPPAPPVDDDIDDNWGGWRQPAVRLHPLVGLRPRPPRIVNPLAPVRTLREDYYGFDGKSAILECTVLLEGGGIATLYWRGPGSAFQWRPPEL